jgi:hypothetical protein
MLQLLQVIHSAEPRALHSSILSELNPAAVEHPFDRLFAKAKQDAAARGPLKD